MYSPVFEFLVIVVWFNFIKGRPDGVVLDLEREFELKLRLYGLFRINIFGGKKSSLSHTPPDMA